ncbi:MAG TPA: purine-nucleoside phosphorylase [Melioribacteraceae bacterium]|nr:purine-nucleoside phosphorylase [Melioribacteraceae bacterium]
MINYKEKYLKLLNQISDLAPFTPDVALILGSGLGDFADSLSPVLSIPTDSLIDYPISTVQGHKGFIHFVEFMSKKVLIFQGRIHFYEGYTIEQCLLPVLICSHLKSKYLILTNAAGGVNPSFVPGDLMLINEFFSLNLNVELAKFFKVINADQRNDLIKLPSKYVSATIIEAAIKSGLHLKEGSYWFGKGPTYETPSEVKMVAHFNVDAVGMSTAHEAIFAAINGMEVGAISLITNHAAGIKPEKLSHQEVIDTAESVKPKFEKLIKSIIELI